MPLKYPTTSRTLLDKIASGDEISWDEFFIRYSPIVKALADRMGCPVSAELSDGWFEIKITWPIQGWNKVN